MVRFEQRLRGCGVDRPFVMQIFDERSDQAERAGDDGEPVHDDDDGEAGGDESA